MELVTLGALASLLMTIQASAQLPPKAGSADPPHTQPCVTHFVRADGTMSRTVTAGQAPHESFEDDLMWTTCEKTITPYVVPTGSRKHPDAAPMEPSVPVRITGPLREGERYSVLVQTADAEKYPPFLLPLLAEGEGRSALVEVPRGTAIGLVVDARNDVVAFSPPTPLRPEGTTLVPVRPKNAAVAGIIAIPDDNEGVVNLALSASDAPVLVRTLDRVFAFWSGDPGPADFSALSQSHLVSSTVDRRRGTVTTIRTPLRRKPSLRVLVTLDDSAAAGGKFAHGTVALDDVEGHRIETLEVVPNVAQRVRHLAPGIVQAVLTIGGMRFARRITLAEEMEGEASFVLEPIRIFGTVTRRDKPAPSQVHVKRDGVAPVMTDDEGRYEVTIWEPGLVIIDVSLKEAAGSASVAPFTELHKVSGSTLIDFRLPGAAALISVTERETGKPLSGVNIFLRTRWTDEAGKVRSQAQTVVTDEAGAAHSAPLREGTLEITASAEGFEKEPPLERTITKDDLLTVPLTLKRSTGDRHVRVLLPGGNPASGAVVALATPDGVIVSTATAGRKGIVELSSGAGMLLLVRHPSAAGHVSLWTGESQDVQLEPATPHLTVRGINGERMLVKRGAVFLFLGGFRIGGAALAFLTDSTPALSSDGLWEGRNLPPAALRVLISSRPGAEVLSGQLDNFAVAIPYPWPSLVNVPTLD